MPRRFVYDAAEYAKLSEAILDFKRTIEPNDLIRKLAEKLYNDSGERRTEGFDILMRVHQYLSFGTPARGGMSTHQFDVTRDRW